MQYTSVRKQKHKAKLILIKLNITSSTNVHGVNNTHNIAFPVSTNFVVIKQL